MMISGGGTTPGSGGGGVFVRSDGSIEAEENHTEVCFGSFGGIWLELGLDVDDEGGADCGEQTGLGAWSMSHYKLRNAERTKMRVVLRSSLYFCMYSVSYSVVSRLYMV